MAQRTVRRVGVEGTGHDPMAGDAASRERRGAPAAPAVRKRPGGCRLPVGQVPGAVLSGLAGLVDLARPADGCSVSEPLAWLLRPPDRRKKRSDRSLRRGADQGASWF